MDGENQEPIDALAMLRILKHREAVLLDRHNKLIDYSIREIGKLRKKSEEIDAKMKRLNAVDIESLAAWMMNPNRDPPEVAFTSGPERMLADAFMVGLRRETGYIMHPAQSRFFTGGDRERS